MDTKGTPVSAGPGRLGGRTLPLTLFGESLLVANRPFPLKLKAGDTATVTKQFVSIMDELCQITAHEGIALDPARSEAILRELQGPGTIFRQLLGVEVMALIAELTLKAQRPLRLSVTAAPDYLAPWPVMYEGDPLEPPEPDDFWGFRYSLGQSVISTHFHHRATISLGAGALVGGHEALAPDQDLAEQIGRQLEPLPGEAVRLEAILPEQAHRLDSVVRAFSGEEFLYGLVHLDLRPAATDQDGANATLTVGGQEIAYRDIVGLSDYRFRNGPLLFLNLQGNSAYWRDASGLAVASMEYGAGAVVIPMVPMPANFAGAFASEFYRRLLDSERPEPLRPADTLRETARYFLEEHNNPLGLAYHFFGPADLQLRRTD